MELHSERPVVDAVVLCIKGADKDIFISSQHAANIVDRTISCCWRETIETTTLSYSAREQVYLSATFGALSVPHAVYHSYSYTYASNHEP